MQSFLEIFDIYLLEAMVNGILLGGLLALLALGLNLIFGVIDVTWICYAELVMIGMYGMYFLVQYYGLSYYVAAPLAILLVAGLGALLHFLVIAPLLSASTSAISASGCRYCPSPTCISATPACSPSARR
jgi:branched-chain amino acid transport system permease protein